MIMPKVLSLFICVCLLVNQAAGIAVPRPVQVCPLIQPEQAPLIDGSLDDAIWKTAQEMTSFWVRDGSAKAAQQTSARALCDGNTLYLAVQCAEESIDKITANRTEQDAAAAWRDDSVEFFIVPDAAKPQWFHLIVTAGGGTYDAKGEGNPFDFDMRLNHKVVIGPHSWTVEVAIGLDSLSIGKVKPGHVMHFNVCRNRMASGELSCWSPTGLAFANPDRFGDLVIGTFGAQQAEMNVRLARSLASAQRVRDQIEPELLRAAEAVAVSLIERVRQPIPDEQWQEVRDAMLDAERRLRRITLRPQGTVLWAPNTWSVPMPEDLPPAGAQDVEAIDVWVFANEFESRALAVSNFGPRTANVRALLTDFISPDGERRSAWDIVTIRTAPPMTLLSNDRKRDPLPRLQDGDLFKVPTGENELLWITFRTRGMEPGRYTGTLIVHDLDHTFRKTVRLTLTVYPIALDDSELPYVHTWARFDYIPQVPVEQRIQHWKDYYHNVGYILYDSMPGYNTNSWYDIDHLDMTKFDHYLDISKEWADFYIFAVNWKYVGEFGKPGPKRWSPEYNRRLGIWVRAIRDRLKARGIGCNRWAFYPFDEVGGDDRERVIRFAQTVKQIDPEILTYCTISSEGNTELLLRMANSVEIIQCSPWSLSRETMNKLTSRPKPAQMWCYNVSSKATGYCHFRGPFVSQTYPNNFKGIGFWSWTNRMGASDWDDFDREGRTDYSAIYTETQGVSRKSEPIVPSLRAEGFREAVEDFKYLKMLDEAIVQAEEAGVDEVLVSTAKQQKQRILKILGVPEWIEDFRRTVRVQITALRVAAGTLDIEAVRAVENPTP